MYFGKNELVFDLPENGPSLYLPVCDVDKPDFKNTSGRERPQERTETAEPFEAQVARHYSNMSALNFGVDNGPYLLGSCTMKYNPKMRTSRESSHASTTVAAGLHRPGQLELMYNLEGYLNDVCGMDAFTFQPSAGAR